MIIAVLITNSLVLRGFLIIFVMQIYITLEYKIKPLKSIKI